MQLLAFIKPNNMIYQIKNKIKKTSKASFKLKKNVFFLITHKLNFECMFTWLDIMHFQKIFIKFFQYISSFFSVNIHDPFNHSG